MVTPNRASMYGHFWSGHSPIDGQWPNANFVAYNNGVHGARVALYHPGVAPQLRAGPNGEIIEAISWNAGSHIRMMCSQILQTSSQRFKRNIRSLRPEYQPTVASHDSGSDTVPLPDIMALRPVVYRLAQEPMKLTHDEDGKPDGGVVPWPDDILGREQRREQLGLIAEEVQNVMPFAVTHSPEGDALALVYSEITVAMLDHVQQLTKRVEALEGVSGNGHAYVGNGYPLQHRPQAGGRGPDQGYAGQARSHRRARLQCRHQSLFRAACRHRR